jgi:hypothetical protein
MTDDDEQTAGTPGFAEQVAAVREAFSEEDRTVDTGAGPRMDPTMLLEALSGGTDTADQSSEVDLAPLIRELQHLRDEVTRIGVALEELVELRRD